jgi:hypothetical protein
MLPTTIAIVSAAYPGADRSRALGAMGGAAAVAAGLRTGDRRCADRGSRLAVGVADQRPACRPRRRPASGRWPLPGNVCLAAARQHQCQPTRRSEQCSVLPAPGRHRRLGTNRVAPLLVRSQVRRLPGQHSARRELGFRGGVPRHQRPVRRGPRGRLAPGPESARPGAVRGSRPAAGMCRSPVPRVVGATTACRWRTTRSSRAAASDRARA